MYIEAPEKQRQDRTKTDLSDRDLRLRAKDVQVRAREFLMTLTKTKTFSTTEVEKLQRYFARMRMQEDGDEGIRHRELFFEGMNGSVGKGEEMERSAVTLHHRFHTDIRNASEKKWISKESREKWKKRFEDPSAEYKDRENWVYNEMPKMVERWKKVAEERDTVVTNERFEDLCLMDPSLGKLRNREAFLNMHYTDRRGLVSKALALINAKDTKRLDLYAAAKGKLDDAARKDYILDGKVGVWLERIFKSKANPKKIAAFVSGTGTTSLEGLIRNWKDVKLRFDTVTQKAKERGINSAAHGFTIETPTTFLSWHYAKRLSYVKQAEARLGDATNVSEELPIFLRIRHAMDVKDWPEARSLIAAAKLEHLKATDWPRLKDMEKHVARFSGTTDEGSSMKVLDAQKRLGLLVEQMQKSHPEMVPLVKRLLRSPNPNRGIHQLRWIAYNNIWCRTHGPPYMDDNVTRKGASNDQVQLTKHRAELGLDIGRNDSLDFATADAAYFRKQETSKHKATFLHTNMSSGGVVSALGEKLEHEQDPRWLYWTTLCPHTNGEPKPEQWMRELLAILSEMRSLTRITGDAPKVSLKPREQSYATAA